MRISKLAQTALIILCVASVAFALNSMNSISQRDYGYSFYHISNFSQAHKNTKRYIINNANVAIHSSNLDLTDTIVKLESIKHKARRQEYFEAHALLMLNSENQEYRLGLNDICDYLIIYKNDKTVCDQEAYQSIYQAVKIYSL